MFQTLLYLGCGIYVILSLILVRYPGTYVIISNLGVVVFSAMLWTQVFLFGGIYSPHLYWIGFVPLLSVLFTGTLHGLVWSVLTLITTLVLYLLELSGNFHFREAANELSSTYYFKSILPYFAFLYVIILAYEKSKINDIKRLEAIKEQIAGTNLLLEEQNQQMAQQQAEITQQRDLLASYKREITKSLEYAHRIQTSIFPADGNLAESFPQFFVLYMPKEIVSGDFYWSKRVGDTQIIAVADCTGHGVPGAFMSMLGVSHLNEIVRSYSITNPAQILNVLRNFIISSLQQKGVAGEQKDGMDMALAIINMKTNELQFAGSNIPLWIITESKQLIEIKPDPIPVAYYFKVGTFTNQFYHLKKGDIIYFKTDGYQDQFGGENHKKFLSVRLKELLIQIAHYPLPQQKQMLADRFNAWKGANEQIDDVTILGVKIV